MSEWPADWYSPDCRRCPRLAAHLHEVRRTHPEYHARPVPPFGAIDAPLVIVGLAPGMHGANRTGRPFTGDYAGILLYESLYALGLSNRPVAVADEDGLVLRGVRITNAVKCLPPANKPTGPEIRECNRYLAAELAASRPRAVLALGRIGHEATLRAYGQRPSAWAFGHGAEHRLPDGTFLVDSYHCSRYNTQTRRLTGEMFLDALERAATLASLRGTR